MTKAREFLTAGLVAAMFAASIGRRDACFGWAPGLRWRLAGLSGRGL
jgi:hypothetical protein